MGALAIRKCCITAVRCRRDGFATASGWPPLHEGASARSSKHCGDCWSVRTRAVSTSHQVLPLAEIAHCLATVQTATSNRHSLVLRMQSAACTYRSTSLTHAYPIEQVFLSEVEGVDPSMHVSLRLLSGRRVIEPQRKRLPGVTSAHMSNATKCLDMHIPHPTWRRRPLRQTGVSKVF